MKRIALFGGSFDPIHRGHVQVALEVTQQLEVQRTVFIPAKQSPLKTNAPLASDQHRFNMIQYAIQGIDQVEVNDCESQRPAPSYTLDTLIHFKQSLEEDCELFWLIGADALNELHHWYRIDEVLDLCQIVLMNRGGYEQPNFSHFELLWGKERVEQLQKHMVQTSLIELSSSEVRDRLATQKDVSELLHPDVLAYIRKHRLYGV